MDSLPKEIQGEIIQRGPRSSLLEVSRVCTLWKKLALERVIIPDSKKKVRMLCHESDFLSLSQRRLPKEWLLRFFAEAGNTKMISRLYGVSTDVYGPGEEHYAYMYWDIDYILMGAGRGGHLELAKWAVSHGAVRCELPSTEIGKGGHPEVVKWFMNDCSESHLIEGLSSGGHLELLKEILPRGGERPCSYSACKNHHLPLVKWMIEENLLDANQGLAGARRGKHQDLIELMISQGGV